MYTSDDGTKKGIERNHSALESGECPECGGALVAIASDGPGATYAEPCGCQLTDFTVREVAGAVGSR